MGAVAKNLIPQLVPQTAEAAPKLFIPEAAATPRTMELEDAQQLSKFVPVIVLVPAGSGKNGNAAGKTTRANSAIENSVTALLLQFLENALPKLKAKHSENGLAFDDVQVSFSRMEATRRGQPVQLTPLEFKTLKYLAENARRVISREELLNEVWGYENYPCTRTVDNLILKLRQKLEREPSRPVHLQTVHSAGYKFLP